MEEVERKGNETSFEALIVPANRGKLFFRPVDRWRTEGGAQAVAGFLGQSSLASLAVQREQENVFGYPITAPRVDSDFHPVGRAVAVAEKARRIDEDLQQQRPYAVARFPVRRQSPAREPEYVRDQEVRAGYDTQRIVPAGCLIPANRLVTRRWSNDEIFRDILGQCALALMSRDRCGYWQGNHRLGESLVV